MSRLSRHKAKPATTNRNASRASGLPKTSPVANQEFDVDGWEPSLLARMRKAMGGSKKS